MLERDETKSWVGGVAVAISESYGINVMLVRLAFVVGFFTFGIGLALYAYLWLNTPAGSNQLRMNFS